MFCLFGFVQSGYCWAPDACLPGTFQAVLSAFMRTFWRVPNGVFQTVFFKFLTLAWHRGTSCQKEEKMLENSEFLKQFVRLLFFRMLTTLCACHSENTFGEYRLLFHDNFGEDWWRLAKLAKFEGTWTPYSPERPLQSPDVPHVHQSSSEGGLGMQVSLKCDWIWCETARRGERTWLSIQTLALSLECRVVLGFMHLGRSSLLLWAVRVGLIAPQNRGMALQACSLHVGVVLFLTKHEGDPALENEDGFERRSDVTSQREPWEAQNLHHVWVRRRRDSCSVRPLQSSSAPLIFEVLCYMIESDVVGCWCPKVSAEAGGSGIRVMWPSGCSKEWFSKDSNSSRRSSVSTTQ